MKKHLGILCSLILVLSLAACGTDFDGSRTELKDYLQGLDLFVYLKLKYDSHGYPYFVPIDENIERGYRKTK